MMLSRSSFGQYIYELRHERGWGGEGREDVALIFDTIHLSGLNFVDDARCARAARPMSDMTGAAALRIAGSASERVGALGIA